MQNEIELQLEFNFRNRVLCPEAARITGTLKLPVRVGHCRVVSRASLPVTFTGRTESGRRVVAVFRPTRNVLKRAFQRGVISAKGHCDPK